MATTGYTQAKQTQQPGRGKGRVGAPLTADGYELITVHAAIFFDGTRNNRYNSTLARLKTAKAQQIVKNFGTSDSYTNFYSNVSILEEMNKRRVPAKFEVSVYVEGAGTNYSSVVVDKVPLNTYYKEDQQGYAFGSGPTGIRDKVTKGMGALRDAIAALPFNPKKQRIGEIRIDVFGFSRGAAAARHFISRSGAFRIWPGQPMAKVTIKFVGLFDTVSSYDNTPAKTGNLGRGMGHLGRDGTKEFSNDVAELGLAIGSNAKRVVHLVAANEYRVNFASTNISSSIAAGIGYEFTLPGAHSDIGGGYKEVEVEVREFYNDRERLALVREGWYHQNQITTKIDYAAGGAIGGMGGTSAVRYLVGERRLANNYQFVSLVIMVLLATKSSLDLQLAAVDENGMAFGEAQFRRYAIPADLLPAAKQIKASAMRHYQPPARATFSLGQDPLSQLVRNRYLHRSASGELGLEALRDAKGNLTRQPIQG